MEDHDLNYADRGYVGPAQPGRRRGGWSGRTWVGAAVTGLVVVALAVGVWTWLRPGDDAAVGEEDPAAGAPATGEPATDAPPVTPPPAETGPAVPEYVTVTAREGLNLRETPGGTILMAVPLGERLRTTGARQQDAEREWLEIWLPDGSRTAWAAAEFLQ